MKIRYMNDFDVSNPKFPFIVNYKGMNYQVFVDEITESYYIMDMFNGTLEHVDVDVSVMELMNYFVEKDDILEDNELIIGINYDIVLDYDSEFDDRKLKMWWLVSEFVQLWQKNPELRFGQLVTIIVSRAKQDLFNITDENMLLEINKQRLTNFK